MEMMKKGKPDGLIAILTKGSNGSKKPEENSGGDKPSKMKEYAQDLLDAISSQDADAVATAFADLADCYQEEGDYTSESDEADEEETM